MQVKIHEAYRVIVAVCDTDLLGKTFVEDNRQIEVRTSFFQGEEKDKVELINLLKDMYKEDATLNIVGKESIACALDAGVISKEGIITIDGIPVALGLM